ncbi:MAG: hypothetical protein ACREUG_00455 [Steroidobacteraceae bacterium]
MTTQAVSLSVLEASSTNPRRKFDRKTIEGFDGWTDRGRLLPARTAPRVQPTSKSRELLIGLRPPWTAAGGVGEPSARARVPAATLAVPWDVLKFNAGHDAYVLDMPPAKLKDAPAFDRDNVQDIADSRWAEPLHKYYGSSAAWYREGSVRMQ